MYSFKELCYKEEQRNKAVEKNMGTGKVLLRSQHACMLIRMN